MQKEKTLRSLRRATPEDQRERVFLFSILLGFYRLLYRNGLRKVLRLIDIAAVLLGNVVSEHL